MMTGNFQEKPLEKNGYFRLVKTAQPVLFGELIPQILLLRMSLQKRK
jgi:hypothetical protein